LNDIKRELKKNAEEFDKFLDSLLPVNDEDTSSVVKAMRYSTLSGGKRIRPFLVMTLCRCFDGDEHAAMIYAAALELVHTYSLIHDDLPCMDNDDFRRGSPTCHKLFGEAVATLAGDALLTYAFELIAQETALSAECRIQAIEIISKAAGTNGMIGGQIMDIECAAGVSSYESMAKMHSLKTGALFKAACLLGCLAAQVNDRQVLSVVETYAEGIGRVFQLVDDLLDDGDGGSDADKNKVTYLSFFTKDMTAQLADIMTEKATESVKSIDKYGMLADTALFLRDRSQ